MLTPSPDYPFIYDPRFNGLRDTYMGLRSFDQGDGVFMAVETLAKRLGLSESTAHRHLGKLQKLEVLEVQKQFQGGGQRTNRYLFPTPGWWVEGCHEGCHRPVEGCHHKTPVDTLYMTTTDVEEEEFSSLNQSTSRINHGAGLRPTRGGGDESQGVREEPQGVGVAGPTPATAGDKPGDGLRPSGGGQAQGVGEAEATDPTAGNTAGAAGSPTDTDSLAIAGSASGPPLPPPGTPMPVGDPRYLFERDKQSRWITVYFESLVIDRDNRLRQAKGQKPITTVGPVRRQKFLDDARRLLTGSNRPTLVEVKAILDWVFTTWLGFLPFPEDAEYPSKDGKVTSFWQITHHYPQLVAAMSKPETAPILPTTTADDEETMPMPMPKAYYDHGEGFPFEDKIPELVEGWIKTKSPSFRARYVDDDVDDDDDFDDYHLDDDDDVDDALDDEPSTFDELFSWRKTFRIMLGASKIPFDEIKLVVDALGDKSLHLNFSRYPTPYDMVGRPGEWEKLLGWVKLALLRQQMLTPAPRSTWDDDEFSYIGGDDDGAGSSSMANVEARRLRYEARQP